MESREKEYLQMKGEFIGRMASLENLLSSLIAEYLHPESYYEEFNRWFVETPIPFSYKVTLLKKMLREYTIIQTNFPDFWKDFYDLQKYRNLLAHSFEIAGRVRTSRGKTISRELITHEALEERLLKLRRLENTVLNMYADAIEGPIGPISADDYADWPI